MRFPPFFGAAVIAYTVSAAPALSDRDENGASVNASRPMEVTVAPNGVMTPNTGTQLLTSQRNTCSDPISSSHSCHRVDHTKSVPDIVNSLAKPDVIDHQNSTYRSILEPRRAKKGAKKHPSQAKEPQTRKQLTENDVRQLAKPYVELAYFVGEDEFCSVIEDSVKSENYKYKEADLEKTCKKLYVEFNEAFETASAKMDTEDEAQDRPGAKRSQDVEHSELKAIQPRRNRLQIMEPVNITTVYVPHGNGTQALHSGQEFFMRTKIEQIFNNLPGLLKSKILAQRQSAATNPFLQYSSLFSIFGVNELSPEEDKKEFLTWLSIDKPIVFPKAPGKAIFIYGPAFRIDQPSHPIAVTGWSHGRPVFRPTKANSSTERTAFPDHNSHSSKQAAPHSLAPRSPKKQFINPKPTPQPGEELAEICRPKSFLSTIFNLPYECEHVVVNARTPPRLADVMTMVWPQKDNNIRVLCGMYNGGLFISWDPNKKTDCKVYHIYPPYDTSKVYNATTDAETLDMLGLKEGPSLLKYNLATQPGMG